MTEIVSSVFILSCLGEHSSLTCWHTEVRISQHTPWAAQGDCTSSVALPEQSDFCDGTHFVVLQVSWGCVHLASECSVNT